MSLKTISSLSKNFHSLKHFQATLRRKSTSGSPTQTDEPENKKQELVFPEEPTTCCSSGCANCVWIKYAQELTQLYDDGDVMAKKKISEKVQDPKLRAFLFTQLGLKETASES